MLDATTSLTTPQTTESGPSLPATASTPAAELPLITTAEVMFATAAVTAVRRRPLFTRVTSTLVHPLSSAFSRRHHEKRIPRRHYPARPAYLESAAMSREMFRL
jgi:hypothetical protein